MSWTPLHRLGFRFAFAYFAFYTTSLFGLSKWLVPRITASLLGITVAPVSRTGSGDTAFDWAQAFSVLLLAAIAAAIWSLLDRKRGHYVTLHGWLHVWLRYGLGMALIGYGMAKVIQTQFPHPPIERLMQTYGDSSPMGLLWTFMGFSAGYNLFAGLAEAIPGLLLFFRRTALLGALLAVAVISNIVALNFFFDVPVKLFSTHLLLIALYIAAPDFPRLIKVFFHNPSAPALNRPGAVRVWQFVKVVLLIALIGSQAYYAQQRKREFASFTKPALYGVYSVENFQPESTGRWDQIVFGGVRGSFSIASARALDGSLKRYRYVSDERSLTLIEGERHHKLELSRPSADLVELSGAVDSAPFKVRLRKRSSGFLLEERGFHWVSEYPFNR